MKGGVKTKTNKDIAIEWDKIANSRILQLNNKEDISMDFVLIPMLLKMAEGIKFSNVIDVGCGTGYFTNKIAPKSNKIVGIDVSEKSINVAKKNSNKNLNIQYITSSIEHFAEKNTVKFSLAFANMTLMDTPNLKEVVKSMSSILDDNAYLILTITHPYFWPFYWDYANEDWFDYSKEIQVENNFMISSNQTKYKTTHFHRPLEYYIETLLEYNFEIIKLIEPMPSENISKKYSKKWKFPRFIGIKCKKVPNKM